MITLERWTERYGERARQEGWGLFETGVPADNTHLLKCDDRAVFADDKHAWAYVAKAAEREEPHAVLALMILARDNPNELRRVHRFVSRSHKRGF